MKSVENGERRVYNEETIASSFKVLRPLTLGCILAFVSLILLITIQDTGFALLFLILMPVFVVIGTIGTIFTAKILTDDGIQYGVRGLSRSQLSQAIHFLDMIQQGHADTGRIIGSPNPEEYTNLTSMTFGSALRVLNAVDKETAQMWASVLQEKLQLAVSAKTKYFLRLTIYGTFIGVFIAFGLEILRMMGVINAAVMLPILIVLVAIVGACVGSLTIYALISSRRNPPAEVISSLEDSQIRYQTERALEKIIQMVKTEGAYPIRVLVLGEHEGLHYTDCIYRTSRDLELKAAILFPDSL